MSLHSDFLDVTWRGTTASDGTVVGVSFNRPDGSVIRLALAPGCAANVAETIQQSLSAQILPAGYDTQSFSEETLAAAKKNILFFVSRGTDAEMVTISFCETQLGRIEINLSPALADALASGLIRGRQ